MDKRKGLIAMAITFIFMPLIMLMVNNLLYRELSRQLYIIGWCWLIFCSSLIIYYWSRALRRDKDASDIHKST